MNTIYKRYCNCLLLDIRDFNKEYPTTRISYKTASSYLIVIAPCCIEFHGHRFGDIIFEKSECRKIKFNKLSQEELSAIMKQKMLGGIKR